MSGADNTTKLRLETPMYWAGPYVELRGHTYRVLAISKDRRELTLKPL